MEIILLFSCLFYGIVLFPSKLRLFVINLTSLLTAVFTDFALYSIAKSAIVTSPYLKECILVLDALQLGVVCDQ